MFATIISSSSNSYNSSSNSSSQSSSEESTTDEGYTSGVPGVLLEVLQEQLRRTFGPQARTSSNIPPSSPLDEVETVYNCAVSVSSKTSEQRLNNLRLW